jgi:hypothetical protein
MEAGLVDLLTNLPATPVSQISQWLPDNWQRRNQFTSGRRCSICSAHKVLDFDRSLTAAKSTFDKRRYLYDPALDLKTEWFYAHLLREAIRNVTKMDLRLHGITARTEGK